MSIFDKAKDAMGEHSEQVGQGVDKAAEFAKGKFGGHEDQIDGAAGKAKDYLGRQDQEQPQER